MVFSLEDKQTMNLVQEIKELIDRSVAEDLGKGDITTLSCIPKETATSGKIILKQSGVLAGLPFLEKIFKTIDPSVEVTLLVEEGSKQKAGTVIAKVSGPARGIISGERIALNFIQHASGVATVTQSYVKRVTGLRCDILDTRKTSPGLRYIEKYAVKVGGGVNHRYGLYDRIIIKNNHLTFFAGLSTHPIIDAYEKVSRYKPEIAIEIEVTDMDQLEQALQTDCESIMLDHMTPANIRQCVRRIRLSNKKVYLESAGAITLETIRTYAETGIDGIAISALTHSVQALDIGMRLMH